MFCYEGSLYPEFNIGNLIYIQKNAGETVERSQFILGALPYWYEIDKCPGPY